MDDVVITGLGTVSCLGSGVGTFWQGMHAAHSAPVRVPDPLAHMELPLMYLVPPADLPGGPEEQDGLPLGRCSQLAVEAARQAVLDAGLGDLDPGRVAVALGSGMGDAELHERWRTGETAKGSHWAPAFPAASVVGGWFGAEGPAVGVGNACAASGYALSLAADLIRAGEADVVITGGAEGYSRVALACFNRLGAIDPDGCRPFAADRRGTVFGEGAAVLVLESAEHARGRGAPRVYARLAGAGWSCDAYHPTAPEPSGAQIERAMREALREAGATVAELGVVVPHGTGTDLNDVVESRILGSVLAGADGAHGAHGAHGAGGDPDVAGNDPDGAGGDPDGAGDGAPVPPITTPLYSVKALVGHTGGSAAAFAVLAAALVLHHGTVPPNVAVGPADQRCPLPLPTGAVPLTAPYGLVNAYAFGGNNISLVLAEAAA